MLGVWRHRFPAGEAPNTVASYEDAERCRPVDWDRWYDGSRQAEAKSTPTEKMAAAMYAQCKRRHTSKVMIAALMDLIWAGAIAFDTATRKLHSLNGDDLSYTDFLHIATETKH